MGFGPNKRKLAFATTPENIAYLREYYHDMKSDARNPGEVLHEALTTLVRADQDPGEAGYPMHRCLDRMRFAQERTNSRSHIVSNLVRREMMGIQTKWNKSETPYDIGYKMYMDAIRGNNKLEFAFPEYAEDFGWSARVDPKKVGVVAETTIVRGNDKQALYRAGVETAHAQVRGFVRGVAATLAHHSVMIHHELVPPDVRNSPLGTKVATADTLRVLYRVIASAADGMPEHLLRYKPLHELSDAALKDGLAFLQEHGLIMVDERGRFKVATMGPVAPENVALHRSQ